VTDRVLAALNRLTTNPNRVRVRSEGSHAWTLKGECRFCGMTRVDFTMQGRPDCKGQRPKESQQASDTNEP
jgi:hypothetical protein